MSTRNDRFNRSMRSLDEFTASFDDPTKIAAFSDKGQGVERMLDEIDHAPGRRTLGRRASCPSETLGRRASCPSEILGRRASCPSETLGRRASCPSETLGRRASCPSENAMTLPDPATGKMPVAPVARCLGICQPATGKMPVAPVPVAPVVRKLHRAEMMLHRAGLGYLTRVLRLIVKNGKNRKESIWELANSRFGR